MKFLVPGDTVVVTGDDDRTKKGKHAAMASKVMQVK